MPLFQYFGWVGSLLLAVPFAANWCISRPMHVLQDLTFRSARRSIFESIRITNGLNAWYSTQVRRWRKEPTRKPASVESSPGLKRSASLSTRSPLSRSRRVFDRPAPPAWPPNGMRRGLRNAHHLEFARV
jgi:hypothetical protein